MKISTNDALKAIENNHRDQNLWIAKAMTLLQLIGNESVDRSALAKQAQEHLNKVPT